MTYDPAFSPPCICPWVGGLRQYNPNCYEHGEWPELESPSPAGGLLVIDPSVVKVFGVDDDDVDWAAYGREAFLQNWRKRAERAEAEVADMQGRSRAMARAIDRGLVAPESIASELLAILDRVVRDNGRRHDLDDVIAAFGFTREDLAHEDNE